MKEGMGGSLRSDMPVGPVGKDLEAVSSPGADAISHHHTLGLGGQCALPQGHIAPNQGIPHQPCLFQHQNPAAAGDAPRPGWVAAVEGVVAGHLVGVQVRADADREGHRLAGLGIARRQVVPVLQSQPGYAVVHQLQLISCQRAKDKVFHVSLSESGARHLLSTWHLGSRADREGLEIHRKL